MLLPAVAAAERPCYMNSLMTESFFTMMLNKGGDKQVVVPSTSHVTQVVVPSSLQQKETRRKFYRDFDL